MSLGNLFSFCKGSFDCHLLPSGIHIFISNWAYMDTSASIYISNGFGIFSPSEYINLYGYKKDNCCQKFLNILGNEINEMDKNDNGEFF